MDNVVALKEFRENLGHYEKLIQAGRSFLVMKRSRLIFMVGPVENNDWEMVIDFTKLRKQGVEIQDLLSRLKKLRTYDR